MSRYRVNPEWQKEMMGLINEGLSIDVTTSYNPAVQWLIKQLSARGVMYKLHQLGAGVKRLVTDQINVCPCCKRKLKEEEEKDEK